MNLARMLVEKRAGLRYRRAQAFMPVARRAFAHIGARSVVVAPLHLAGVERISVGARVIVRDGAWLATENAASTLAIGDETYIGYRAHLHAIDTVSIGSRCVFADNVMVTTTDHDRVHRHVVHGTGPVVIEDDVFLGQNVVVLGGVRIGAGATVAAGAVVVDDVPAGTIFGGVPARLIGSDTTRDRA